MDDPWGSPWAEDLRHLVPTPDTKGRDGLTLAPMSLGKDAITVAKTDSPWDVSADDFRDWAGASEVQYIKENGEAANISPTWGARGTGDTKKIDSNGLSPHWDESREGSEYGTPKLGPGPLPKPKPVSRDPSPDPWVTVAVSPHGVQKKEILKLRSEDTKVDLENTTLPEVRENYSQKQHESLLEQEGPSPQGPEDTQPPMNTVERSSSGNDADEISRCSTSPSDHSHHDELPSESPRTSLDDDIHRPHVSRELSEKVQVLVEHYDTLAKSQLGESIIIAGSYRSDAGDDDALESIAKEKGCLGVDNEANEKDNADEKDDANKRNKADETTEVKQNTVDEKMEAESEEEDEEDDFGDFGDFEGGGSQFNEPNEAGEQASSAQSNSPDVKELAPPTATIPPVRAPEINFGRVEYTIDVLALDTLYPSIKAEPTRDPANRLFIPDSIPHDSFSSVEQRKMWYRLSRYSSLRKYNNGDDDNYVRVTWVESKVREDTLKIVGKWMEQDRISGRVILGGDSKDGSLFGWNDPKAAPLPLAAAFAITRGKTKYQAPVVAEVAPELPRDRSKGHAKKNSSSQSGSPPKQRRQSSTKASRTSEDMKQKTQIPVASFGWNSDSQPAPPLLVPSKTPEEPMQRLEPPVANFGWNSDSQSMPPLSISNSVPLAFQSTQPQFSQMLGPSAELLAGPEVPTPITSAEHKSNSSTGLFPALPDTRDPGPNLPSDDLDDDWGDMISSPVVTGPLQIPTSRGLTHKKSQSLIGISAPLSQVPPDRSAIAPIPSGNSHRVTTSLDGTSISQIHNSGSASTMSNQVHGGASASNAFSHATSNAPLVPNSSYDPWAAADFSFFESAPAPQKPKSAPLSNKTPTQPPRLGTRSVAFASTPAAVAPPAPRRGGSGKMRQELEQDRIVASIIKGLPNLSYMLRR